MWTWRRRGRQGWCGRVHDGGVNDKRLHRLDILQVDEGRVYDSGGLDKD